MGNTYITIGGDFNQVRDPALDKSKVANTKSVYKSQVAIEVLEEELGLVDIWRVLHPQEREYTFYSNPHASYSRIDYFLISKQLVSTTVTASIGNIVLSDNALVEVLLGAASLSETPRSHWRLNTSLLQNEKSCNFIRKEILECWEFNEGSTSNPGIEWDALKVCLRGRLIQHSSYLKRQTTIRLLELEKEIKDLEIIYASQLDPAVFTQLNKRKLELNSILEEQKKAECALFQCRQRYYEQGEVAGRFLAQRVKQQHSRTLIPSVENEKGTLVTNRGEINETFRVFYQKLYTSQGTIDQEDIDNFMPPVYLPILSEEKQKEIYISYISYLR